MYPTWETWRDGWYIPFLIRCRSLGKVFALNVANIYRGAGDILNLIEVACETLGTPHDCWGLTLDSKRGKSKEKYVAEPILIWR
jgi:hypothetical protein